MRCLFFILLGFLPSISSFGKEAASEKQTAHFAIGVNYLKGSSHTTGSDPQTSAPKKWSLTSEGLIGHFGMVGSNGLALLGVVDLMDTYSDRDQQTKTRDYSQRYVGLGFSAGYDGPFWKLMLQGTNGNLDTSKTNGTGKSGYDASCYSLIWGYNLLKGDTAGSAYVFTTLREHFIRGDTLANETAGRSTYSALLGFGMQFNADEIGIALLQTLINSSKRK